MKYSKEQIAQVVSLKSQAVTHRDISEKVFGVRSMASVVYRILKKHYYTNKVNKSTVKPKILVLDIETAPCLSNHWGLWKQNIGLNQVVRDWAILSWSAKWLDNDYVMYDDIREQFDGSAESIMQEIDDSKLLNDLWQLLDEADIVVTQNGVKFDTKKMNARFVINGMKPPSSYKQIDTMLIAKKHFGFTSNSLAYMTDKLCKKYKKLPHGKFPNFELWKECLLGNEEAWDEMEEYNKYDVLSLQELLFILAPWSNSLPNLDLYYDDEKNHCLCGSTEFHTDGFAYTAVSKFVKLKCKKCGHEKRDRVNLLSKSKRKSLKTNVRSV